MPRQFLCLTCGAITRPVPERDPRCEKCGRGNGIIEPTQQEIDEYERRNTLPPNYPSPG